MKVIGILLYCLAFFAYGVLFSKSYLKFNISYEVWLGITVASTILLVAELIYENFFYKK